MNNQFLENLKNKEFYKNNWHRFLVAPILFFGIFFSSMVYLISAGFYIVLYLSLLVGFIFSILFAINYNKYYFFVLVLIVLLQIITVNIDTKNSQHYMPSYPIGQYSSEGYGDFYYKINASCSGLKRNYYESTYCVGGLTNCSIEIFSKIGNQLINKKSFSCIEYDKTLKEKQDIFIYKPKK